MKKIKSKIVAVIALTAVISITAALLVSSHVVTKGLQDTIARRIRFSLTVTRRMLLTYHDEAFRSVMTLANLPEINKAVSAGDVKKLQEFCVVSAVLTDARKVYVIDAAGNIISKADSHYWRQDFSSILAPAEELTRYESVQSALKGLAGSQLYIEDDRGNMVIAAPIDDGGTLAGAVVMTYQIDQRLLQKMYNAANTDVQIQLGDLSLSTLTGWDKSRVQRKLYPDIFLEKTNGGLYATAYAPLPSWGAPVPVSVGVAYPFSDLLQTVYAVRRMLLIIAAALILAALVIGEIFSRGIARPLEQFTRFTTEVAAGRLSEEIEVKTRDELGILAQNFNRMIRALRKIRMQDRDASPLTGLPGVHAIRAEIEARITRKEPWAIAYFDLDNFKGFNDRYGFERGNDLLRFLADLIVSVIDPEVPDNFVGHIGGDDFVALAPPDVIDEYCREIVKRFDAGSRRLYDEADLKRGFIQARNRQGRLVRQPLVTLSIAIVADDGSRFSDYFEVSRVATELKNYVKNLPGSTYFRDRRGPGRS